MLCLRSCQTLRALLNPSAVLRTTSSSSFAFSKRTFTSITPLRPTLTSFRPAISSITGPSASETVDGTLLDLLPKISSHPALGATQIRCGPRNTFSPSHFVRKRRHGFLSRIRTRKGKMLLKRRLAKGRQNLSH